MNGEQVLSVKPKVGLHSFNSPDRDNARLWHSHIWMLFVTYADNPTRMSKIIEKSNVETMEKYKF